MGKFSTDRIMKGSILLLIVGLSFFGTGNFGRYDNLIYYGAIMVFISCLPIMVLLLIAYLSNSVWFWKR